MNCRILVLVMMAASGVLGQETWLDWNKAAREAYEKEGPKPALQAALKGLPLAANESEKAESLNLIGFLYHQSGDLVRGEVALRESLEIWRRVAGNSVACGTTLYYLARLLRDIRKLEEALNLAEESARVLQNGGASLELADSLTVLGGIHGRAGRYGLAEENMKRAALIYKSLPSLSPNFATLLVDLGATQERLSKPHEAKESYSSALQVWTKFNLTSHPVYGATLSNMALIEMQLGSAAEAETHLLESLSIFRKTVPDHPLIAVILGNLGVLYGEVRDYERAKRYLQESLDRKRGKMPPLDVALSLVNLARLLMEAQPKDSERWLMEAVDVLKDGPPYELAVAVEALGDAQLRTGDLDGAGVNLAKALNTAQMSFGPDHIRVAMTRELLSKFHLKMGEDVKAEDSLLTAIVVMERTRGKASPYLVQPLLMLGGMHKKRGDLTGSLSLYRRAFEIERKRQSDVLGMGSESTKAAMASRDADVVTPLVELLQQLDTQEVRELAFEAVSWRKGRVLEFVRSWRAAIQIGETEEFRKRFEESQHYQECAASLSTAEFKVGRPASQACSLAGTELAGRYDELLSRMAKGRNREIDTHVNDALRELNLHIARVQEELQRSSPRFAQLVRPITAPQVASSLRQSELLLDIVGYGNGRGRRYGVFLMSERTLQWIDIGLAETVDNGVRRMLAASMDWNGARADGNETAMRTYERNGESAVEGLDRALSPLLRALETKQKYTRLRIAPDGLLCMLPFEALRARGSRVISHFTVSYLNSARELSGSGMVELKPGPALIAVSPGPSPIGTTQRAPQQLEYLPSVEKEADFIRSLLIDSVGLGKGTATEAAIKKIRDPIIFHMGGHGLMVGNDPCQDERSDCRFAALSVGERAMAGTMFVVEEAYQRGGITGDDGYLSALELQNMHLRGTEMVVLAQCHMANGTPSSSDGVYGMLFWLSVKMRVGSVRRGESSALRAGIFKA